MKGRKSPLRQLKHCFLVEMIYIYYTNTTKKEQSRNLKLSPRSTDQK